MFKAPDAYIFQYCISFPSSFLHETHYHVLPLAVDQSIMGAAINVGFLRCFFGCFSWHQSEADRSIIAWFLQSPAFEERRYLCPLPVCWYLTCPSQLH